MSISQFNHHLQIRKDFPVQEVQVCEMVPQEHPCLRLRLRDWNTLKFLDAFPRALGRGRQRANRGCSSIECGTAVANGGASGGKCQYCGPFAATKVEDSLEQPAGHGAVPQQLSHCAASTSSNGPTTASNKPGRAAGPGLNAAGVLIAGDCLLLVLVLVLVLRRRRRRPAAAAAAKLLLLLLLLPPPLSLHNEELAEHHQQPCHTHAPMENQPCCRPIKHIRTRAKFSMHD